MVNMDIIHMDSVVRIKSFSLPLSITCRFCSVLFRADKVLFHFVKSLIIIRYRILPIFLPASTAMRFPLCSWWTVVIIQNKPIFQRGKWLPARDGPPAVSTAEFDFLLFFLKVFFFKLFSQKISVKFSFIGFLTRISMI